MAKQGSNVVETELKLSSNDFMKMFQEEMFTLGDSAYSKMRISPLRLVARIAGFHPADAGSSPAEVTS